MENNEILIPVSLQVIEQTGAPLQTLLNHWCIQHMFPITTQTFSSLIFDHPGPSGD